MATKKTSDWYKAQASKAAAKNRPTLEAYKAKISSLTAEAHKLAISSAHIATGESFGNSSLGRHIGSQVEGTVIDARTQVEFFVKQNQTALWNDMRGLTGLEWQAYFEVYKPFSELVETIYPTAE